jgi:hypothetical protein
MGQRRICGKIDIIVIASLFQKVEQILTGYVFEKKEKKVRGLQRAMQRDNVGMHRHGLVDGRLLGGKGNSTKLKNFRARKGQEITETLPLSAVRVLPHQDRLWTGV